MPGIYCENDSVALWHVCVPVIFFRWKTGWIWMHCCGTPPRYCAITNRSLGQMYNKSAQLNEWMKFYIAHVSSWRLFRALNIGSNLARPVIIQIPTQSPGRYTAELPFRRIKLFSFQANSPYVPSTHTSWIFWGLAGWKLRLRPLRFFYVYL